MRFYYETSPLPAGLSWRAHQLPAAFHTLESWGALVLELLVPFLIWGPQRARKLAFFALTGFQIVNTATANYGFFTFMTMALHVFLLCDAEVDSAGQTLRASLQQSRALLLIRTILRKQPRAEAEAVDDAPVALALGPLRHMQAFGGYAWLGAWLLASLIAALVSFGHPARDSALLSLHATFSELRVANPYHLFGQITRERIEPQFETLDASGWHEHDMHFKPGDPKRSPPYVAPHQPRVDFRLWFYGLSFRRGTPRYVTRLLQLLCDNPESVQSLFVAPLPQAPQAVRIEFLRYHFTTAAERARSSAYWTRESLGALPPRNCR